MASTTSMWFEIHAFFRSFGIRFPRCNSLKNDSLQNVQDLALTSTQTPRFQPSFGLLGDSTNEISPLHSTGLVSASNVSLSPSLTHTDTHRQKGEVQNEGLDNLIGRAGPGTRSSHSHGRHVRRRCRSMSTASCIDTRQPACFR